MDTQIKNTATPSMKRWSATKGKAWTGPKWSRFRLFVQYYNGNAKYHSFDYTYKHVQGYKTKIKSELIGLTKLMELMHKKTKGKLYRYANIFANISGDLNTTTGNFDYLVCTIVNGEIKWKDPISWKTDDNNMLDIAKMRAFAEQMRDKEAAEKLAEERKQTFQQTIFGK